VDQDVPWRSTGGKSNQRRSKVFRSGAAYEFSSKILIFRRKIVARARIFG
jgi:hypothetical protein